MTKQFLPLLGFITLQVGCNTSPTKVELDGLTDFGEVQSSLYHQTSAFTFHEITAEGTIVESGTGQLSQIRIANFTESCSDIRDDLETKGELMQKVIDAAGESMELSNACQEMGDLQDYLDSIEGVFPRKFIDVFIDFAEETDAQPIKGTFDSWGTVISRTKDCSTKWDKDSCSFVPADCTGEETQSNYMEGTTTIDGTFLNVSGSFTGTLYDNDDAELGSVDIDINASICETQAPTAFFVFP